MSESSGLTISIITICYNSESYIRTAIESVLNQSYDNIEYVIIDGKSQDNTVSIIKEYEKKFNGRMKWVSEEDSGLYDAMNKGIACCSGDVVGILNSDDFYSSDDIISKIMDFFIDENIGAVTGDVHFVLQQDITRPVRVYSSKYCIPALFRFGCVPAHLAFFVRKKYYELWGNYNCAFDISADFDLMIRFLKVHKLPYKYVETDVVTMRLGGKSTQSIKSIAIDNNRNIIHVCKNNNIYTNMFFISFRYIFKLWGICKAICKK